MRRRDLFVADRIDDVGGSQQHAVALDDVALMGEVERGQLNVFLPRIHPDVEFGPVADREDAKRFVELFLTVVDVPQFGTLVLGVPLSEGVAVRKEALLGACFFLVAACATDGGFEAQFLERVEQRHGLEPVAAGIRSGFFDDTSLVDGILDVAHDQACADLLHELVAVADRFVEVVSGVDVQQRKRDGGGIEGFAGEMAIRIESLPPEKSSTGRSNCAATSRII